VPRPHAFLFDAYGTLFDVHSVVEAGRALTGDPAALSALWRQKQLEYTWLRSLMGRYEDFWAVTESALRFAVKRLSLPVTEAQIRSLMDAYLALTPFPETRAALERLGADGPLGILSNGSPRMLASVVERSGLGPLFRHVLSVDRARVYKPSPAVYAMGPEAFALPAHEILFVSSNAWDVAGARAYGYVTCWCNRLGAPMDELGVRADLEVERLDQIPALLA
jgi:2-haloacid dehalogenase